MPKLVMGVIALLPCAPVPKSILMNQIVPPPLKVENRFPDCVFMKLHSVPVEPEQPADLVLPVTAQSTGASTRKTNLKLTIRFYKQTIKVPGGEVEFGIRRGELNLKLTNGRIPLETMGLTAPFEIEVEVEEQHENGQETEVTVAVAGSAKRKGASKTTTKQKSKVHRVANRGTEENPVWEFSMEPHLKGMLNEAHLGTAEKEGDPCSVEAIFAVRSQTDIQLGDSTGLFRAKNLSRNISAILTHEFFLRFLAPKLQPYLSQVKGHL